MQGILINNTCVYYRDFREAYDHDAVYEMDGALRDVLALVAAGHDNDFLEEVGNHDVAAAVVADVSDGVEAVTDNSYRHHSNSHHAVHSL